MSRELPDLDGLFVYNDPEGSEARYIALLPRAKAEGEPPYICELLTRLARSQGLQRRFEDAHKTLDEAVAPQCDEPACRVRIALERGRLYNSAGERDEARPLFLEAWSIATASGQDALAVDAAHMMGIVESGPASLEWNERAIAAAENSEAPEARRWFGSLYNNTAWTYHDLGQYERALELFQKAREHRLALGQVNEERIARWCIARCLRSMGCSDEALSIQRQLLDEYAGAGEGYVEEELGELHLAAGAADEARPYFAAAYEKLSKDIWLQANELERLDRLKMLSAG